MGEQSDEGFQPHTPRVSDTKSPLFLPAASHLTRKLLQWVFRLNVLSFVWPVAWKLWDSTVDDMLTYSLKALHVGADAACHMTANIRLMSCSRPRVDAHVLFEIGCFYLRRDWNGLSVATHMDGEAPDQDRSRRSRWFTVSVQQAGGEPVVGPPAIRVLFCVECDTSIELVQTAICGVLETAGFVLLSDSLIRVPLLRTIAEWHWHSLRGLRGDLV